MNNKMRILSIMIILGLLAGGLLLYLLYQDMTTMPVAVALVAFVLGLLALGISYWRRAQVKSILGPKEMAYYEDLSSSINTSNLTLREKQDANRQLLEVIYEAKKNNKELDEVIGEDNEAFIKELLEAYGGKQSLIKTLARSGQYFLLYILALQGITFTMEPNVPFFATKTLLLLLVAYGLIIFVGSPLLQHGFKKGRSLRAGIGLLGLIMGIAAMFIMGEDSLVGFLYQEVVVFSSLTSLALLLLLLGSLQVIYKRK